ncbi:hypothetical protein INR49_001406 [Caranx melampygus]|nr:hypothetical protein INR49_001406 [Caranx melampygus]
MYEWEIRGFTLSHKQSLNFSCKTMQMKYVKGLNCDCRVEGKLEKSQPEDIVKFLLLITSISRIS